MWHAIDHFIVQHSVALFWCAVVIVSQLIGAAGWTIVRLGGTSDVSYDSWLERQVNEYHRESVLNNLKQALDEDWA